MHGVKRSRQSAEAIQAREEKERSKLKEYLELADVVLHNKRQASWSKESFDLTTRLLTMNPEFYTVWNYRRDILTNGIFPNLLSTETKEVLHQDLLLTMSFLRQHPKVYWIWNHRRWCLENMPASPGDDPDEWKKVTWANELYTINKMLDADARNFLAWDYRRYVLASMPIKRPATDELEYTTHKIESNFSNFSAWHQRSKLYSSLWEAGDLEVEATKEKEFELVKQALYVDPYDQSGWIYHRWLVGTGDDKSILEREIAVIEDLLQLEPGAKWCLESLVHYKKLLVERHYQGSHIDEIRRTLIEECLRMLKTLEGIDPKRKRRYADMTSQFLAM